jgi:hypothetical protein
VGKISFMKLPQTSSPEKKFGEELSKISKILIGWGLYVRRAVNLRARGVWYRFVGKLGGQALC